MVKTTLAERRKADRTLRKITLYSVIALSTVIFCIAAFLFFIALKSQPTIEYFNLPFPTDKLEYHPTDSIKYKVEFRKLTNVPAEVSRQLVCVNGEERYSRSLQGGVSGISETPDEVEYESSIVITSATPGDVPLNVACHIETTAKYVFNAFRVEYARGKTTEFRFVDGNTPLRDNPAINQSRLPGGTVRVPAILPEINPPGSNTSNTTNTTNSGNNSTTIENNDNSVNLPDVNLPGIDLNLENTELNRIINTETNAPVEKPKTEILAPITSPVGNLIIDLLQ